MQPLQAEVYGVMIRGTASIVKIAMTIYTKPALNAVMTFAEMMCVITTMNRTAKTVMMK